MKFLRSLSRRALLVVAALSLAGLVGFGSKMSEAGKALQPDSIVTLELAFTPARAMTILTAWDTAGRDAALQSLLLDFGFILLGYAPLLASLCLLRARKQTDKWKGWGERLAFFALVAGGLDLVENAALWGVVQRPLNPPGFLTWTAGIAAAIKFALVFAATAYLSQALARLTPLVQWLLSYPILVLVAALVLGLLWQVALASFGIPDLFWDERWLLQLLAGFGVGTLLVHLGVMGFLMDSHRAALRGQTYCGAWSARIAVAWALKWIPVTTEAPILLAGYLLRTSLPLLCVALLSAVRAPGGVSPWWLPIGALVSFAVSLIVIVRVSGDRVPVLWIIDKVDQRIRNAAFTNLHRLAQLFVLIQVVVYAILWLLYALDQRVSVALAVCVLLAGLASVYGFLKYFFSGSTFGVLAGAFVVVVAVSSLGGHRLPGFDYATRVKLNQQTAQPREARPAHEDLEAWKAARGGGRPPLIVVAVDGGGIRAGVWASVVMAQLERDVPNFPYFVHVVTGASGGMVGIASYVASLQPPDSPSRHRDLEEMPLSLEQVVDRVALESLGTVARTLVFKDLLLPPFLHASGDRGLALERAWEQDTRILGQPFANLAPGEAAGWRPSLIVSPLIVEDGRRLLISNLELGDLSTIPVEPPSLQALQYFGHIESRPGALRLSTAVRMNASFPYVSPAAELPTSPPRHVLDAGYYDEHGVELAGTWIWTHRQWLDANTGGVLLIQVPDARARARKEKASEDRRDWWGAGLIGVTGPIEALRASGSAAADYRNDQLVRVLGDTFNATKPGFFATVVFEPDETSPSAPPEGCGRSGLRRYFRKDERPFRDVALSWRLTGCEVSRLKQSIGGGHESGSCADRRQFQAWWNAHKPDSEPVLAVQCPPQPSSGRVDSARADGYFTSP